MWPFTRASPAPRETSEFSPLLSSTQNGGARTVLRSTPLPKKQILVICAMRFTEPVSYTLIFPFINQMLEDLHVTPDRSRIGYYAGIIESLFAFSQMLTVFFWGSLSDRIGRKPVLLTGLAGLAISIAAFGLQKSFVGLILARVFAGVMNGNIAVLKSVLAEITDETNQARAFSLLPMCYALGSIVGPVIGGYLAKPSEQYPGLFGSWGFLVEYPYFLPCALAGALNLGAVLLGLFYLEETLPARRPGVLKDLTSGPGSALDAPIVPADPPPSVRSLLTRPILLIIADFSLLAFVNSAWAAVIPLFSYTRVADGGLGLSLNQIGTALSANGIMAVLIQTLLFPPIQQRAGTVPLLRAVLLTLPICFAGLSLLGGAARHLHLGTPTTVGLLTLVLGIKSLSSMGTVCVTMLVNNSAPSRSALGTLNGISQMGSSLARTFGPVATASLFALSIDRHVLGGQLVWLVCLFFGLAPCIIAMLVRDPKPAWRPAPAPALGTLSGSRDAARAGSERGLNALWDDAEGQEDAVALDDDEVEDGQALLSRIQSRERAMSFHGGS